MAPQVSVFFYGSYMNRSVLAAVGLAPDAWEVARLHGFDVVIEPLANLLPRDGATAYGALALATHAELDRLYAHAREVLGGVYLPWPVLVERRDGAWRAALCYLAPAMNPAPADAAYVDRIVAPARDLGFPDWYVARLQGFRS